MLKLSEIFAFFKEKFRKIPILKEFEWFEWFEWFGPSPIEPFNSARRRVGAGRLDLGPAAVRQERHGAPELRLEDLQNLQN